MCDTTVTIDYEDREQVERIAATYVAAAEAATKPYGLGKVDMVSVANSMQAALREFANPTPPKPDEPTGHMAVVEDTDGLRWVNWRDPRATGEHERPWVLASDSYTAREWRDINAVRVLSEGVTA